MASYIAQGPEYRAGAAEAGCAVGAVSRLTLVPHNEPPQNNLRLVGGLPRTESPPVQTSAWVDNMLASSILQSRGKDAVQTFPPSTNRVPGVRDRVAHADSVASLPSPGADADDNS